jgi:zinc and cadmium transporter
LSVTGDAVHNLIDGMVIAASFQVDAATGIATTTAVVLHEVPQEIGDYGVLLFGGLERRRAVMVNLISATTAILGALVVLLVGAGAGGVARALIPVAAGGFLYIAAADLVPALREFTERMPRHLLLVLTGIGLTALPLGLAH